MAIPFPHAPGMPTRRWPSRGPGDGVPQLPRRSARAESGGRPQPASVRAGPGKCWRSLPACHVREMPVDREDFFDYGSSLFPRGLFPPLRSPLAAERQEPDRAAFHRERKGEHEQSARGMVVGFGCVGCRCPRRRPGKGVRQRHRREFPAFAFVDKNGHPDGFDVKALSGSPRTGASNHPQAHGLDGIVTSLVTKKIASSPPG